MLIRRSKHAQLETSEVDHLDWKSGEMALLE